MVAAGGHCSRDTRGTVRGLDVNEHICQPLARVVPAVLVGVLVHNPQQVRCSCSRRRPREVLRDDQWADVGLRGVLFENPDADFRVGGIHQVGAVSVAFSNSGRRRAPVDGKPRVGMHGRLGMGERVLGHRPIGAVAAFADPRAEGRFARQLMRQAIGCDHCLGMSPGRIQQTRIPGQRRRQTKLLPLRLQDRPIHVERLDRRLHVRVRGHQWLRLAIEQHP